MHQILNKTTRMRLASPAPSKDCALTTQGIGLPATVSHSPKFLEMKCACRRFQRRITKSTPVRLSKLLSVCGCSDSRKLNASTAAGCFPGTMPPQFKCWDRAFKLDCSERCCEWAGGDRERGLSTDDHRAGMADDRGGR